MSAPIKVSCLNAITIPYFAPRFTAFANHFPQYQLQVIDLCASSHDYWWDPPKSTSDYERVVLSDLEFDQASQFKLTRLLLRTLQQTQPEVVIIGGYASIAMLAALAWCLWFRKPVVIYSDTKADDASRQPWFEALKSLIIRQYRSALVAGKAQQQYLAELGLPEEASFLGYHAMDNDYYHPSKISELPCPHPNPFFLAINRFIPKKNLSRLIEAYARYVHQAKTPVWDLVLCGDGVLKDQLIQQIQQLGMVDRVKLPGFLQPDELLPYFAHAQCLVHASTQEQWGLVVHEAMAAGLPVLVSNRCGCYLDLVAEGVNGFGFDPLNVEQLAAQMEHMSSEQTNLQAMGQASLDRIQYHALDNFANGLHQAIQYSIA